MALELLHGPSPAIRVQDGVTLGVLSHFDTLMWIDPVGILAQVYTSGEHIILMDGAGFYLHDGGSNGEGSSHLGLALLGDDTTHIENNTRWYSSLVYTSGTTPSTERKMDEVALTPTDTLSVAGPPQQVTSSYASLIDRFIRFNAGRVETHNGTSWVAESPNLVGTLTTTARMSWAREENCIWITGANGAAVLYDYVAKQFVGPVYTIDMAVLGMWYSRKHNVFISLHGDSLGVEVRVWATTVKPISISAPVSETTVKAGKAMRVKTQVLGSNADPCVGEVVEWSTTGGGYMQLDTSVTDTAGWAYNTLVLPLSTPGPSVDVNVSLGV